MSLKLIGGYGNPTVWAPRHPAQHDVNLPFSVINVEDMDVESLTSIWGNGENFGSDLTNHSMVREGWLKIQHSDAGDIKSYRQLLSVWRLASSATEIATGTFTAVGTDGKRTFTSTIEGLLVKSDGSGLCAAGDKAFVVGGALFERYVYTYHASNGDWNDSYATGMVDEIKPGQWLWVIRRGIVYLKSTGAVTNGDILICADDGEVSVADAIDTTSVTTLNTTLRGRLFGDGYADGRAVAVALETIAAAGMVKAELRLPMRYVEITTA